MKSYWIVIILAICCLPALSTAASAQETEVAPPVANQNFRVVTDPIEFSHKEGNFQVYFPPGCAKIRMREPSDGGHEEAGALRLAIFAFSDRWGRKGEGCSVTAWIDDDVDVGKPADPPLVIAKIESIVEEYGARIKDQRPYRRKLLNGPKLEGLDVLATDPEEKGEVWVRGLLVEGDIYLLAAWRAEGRLSQDPEIIAFFNSFQAHMP